MTMTEHHQFTLTELQQVTLTETDSAVGTADRTQTSATEEEHQITVEELLDVDMTGMTEKEGDSDWGPSSSGRMGQRKNYADINKGKPDTKQDNGQKTHQRQTSISIEKKTTETEKTDDRN